MGRRAGLQQSGNLDADGLTTLSCVRNDNGHFRLDYSNFERADKFQGMHPRQVMESHPSRIGPVNEN